MPYTFAPASGAAGSETVTLPALTSASNTNDGLFNGVVFSTSPTNFASGQLTSLFSYESSFGVRQVDGYGYPTPSLGLTAVSGGALDGTTGTLTAAGQTLLPGLGGTIPFDTGTYGYPATVATGLPVGASETAVVDNSSGDVLLGVYQHPVSTADPQSGVAEMTIGFDYNAAQTQWLVLGPALIDWVTNGEHLGMYRNYVEMDIDDTFTPDDAWNATTHSIDYSDADALRMNPADVAYAAEWSQAHHFRLDQLFNGGGSVAYQEDNGGVDPLLAAFQATDPATGKPYADDFGWISHTYDTPYLDVGCATQNYIEAELNENTNWAAAPGAGGTGGLGLTSSSNDAISYGAEDPQVFVPGNHSGFADLVPGNPATVDPPDLDPSSVGLAAGASLAGSYEYAVTDQFANDSPATDQSQAYLTGPFTVSPGQAVTLSWEGICHAQNYLVYREVAGSNEWYQIGNVSTPFDATSADTDNNPSTSDVTGGGEPQLTFTDTGNAGTTTGAGFTATETAPIAEPSGWTPPTEENANELPWEQNPNFIPALEAVGITAVGADASKAYPEPPEQQFGYGTSYSGAEYAPGQTFVDGTAQVVPRHPINIYYNASTEAQEVDEYNTLYYGSGCVDTSTTTCLSAPATFQSIVSQVDEGMLQNMLNNDPEPSYVHQTNIMGEEPATIPSTPPNTPDTTGDGLLYSVLDPLLADYAQYFSASTPYVQLTEGQIATELANKAAWAAPNGSSTVSASISNGVMTVTNNGSSSLNVPVTAPDGATSGGTAFGSPYGATTSAWESLPAGGSLTINVLPQTGSTGGTTTVAGSATFTGQVSTASSGTTYSETGGTSTPAGISVSSTGAVTTTGTLAVGSYVASGTDTSAGGISGSWSYTLVVTATPLVQTSTTSATVTAGTAYSGQLAVSGATGAVSYSLTGGSSSPAGVAVSSSGAITAAATLPVGTYVASGKDADGYGDTGTFTFTLTVGAGTLAQAAPLTGTTSTAKAFSAQLAVSGAHGTTTFATTGASPFSVSSTGAVTAPATLSAGKYTASGTDRDSLGDSGTWSFTLTVTGSALVQGAPLSASVTTTTAYSGQLTVTGNHGTVSFAETKGSGVTVSSSGAVTAPNTLAAGNYTVSGTDVDSLGDTGSWSFTLTVRGTVILDGGPILATVKQGSSYAGQLTVAGSHGTVTFAETSGSPSIVVSSSGKISASALDSVGVHLAIGTVTDSFGDTGSWLFALVVLPASGLSFSVLGGLAHTPGPALAYRKIEGWLVFRT